MKKRHYSVLASETHERNSEWRWIPMAVWLQDGWLITFISMQKYKGPREISKNEIFVYVKLLKSFLKEMFGVFFFFKWSFDLGKYFNFSVFKKMPSWIKWLNEFLSSIYKKTAQHHRFICIYFGCISSILSSMIMI